MKLPFCFLLLGLWVAASGSDAAPKLVVQGDKTYQFRAVMVSNAGKWIASNDHEYGNIKIFAGQSGLQWGEFPAASGASPLRFTPDATRILTTQAFDALNGEQTEVALCEVPTGRKLRSFAVAPYPIWCDNARLRGFRDGALVEFDLKSGRQNFSRQLQDAPQVPSSGRDQPRFAFSENGAFLVERRLGVIRFWKLSSGQLLGRIENSLRAIGNTAISNDGKWLASEGDDPAWSSPTDGPMTQAAFARTFRLHVWNARTRKLTRTFPGYYSLAGGARLLAFSPDARTLWGAGEGGLDRFNLQNGKNSPLPTPQKNFRNGMGWPLAVSNDGAWLAGVGTSQSSDFGPGLQLWSLQTSALRARFGGTLRGPSQVKWSPDGKYLAGGNRLALWDARTGKLVAEKPESYLADFSWVNATTIRSQTLGKMQIWSVPDLKLKSEFDFSPPKKDQYSNEYSGGLSIAPDGRTILTTDTAEFGGLKGELWVWDAASKKLLRKIKTEKDSWDFSQFVWLPDNRRVVFGTRSQLILLDTQTGIIEKQYPDSNAPQSEAAPFNSAPRPLRVSPDGKWLAATSRRDNQTVIFDLKTFDLNPAEGLKWWEAETAKTPALHGASNNEEGTLSPDGRLMAFGSDSITRNGVSIWNLAEGREVVRLYLLGGNSEATSLDWIALTPEGFYDASPNGEKRLRWREGNAFWPVAKSRAQFRRPALIAQALRLHLGDIKTR